MATAAEPLPCGLAPISFAYHTRGSVASSSIHSAEPTFEQCPYAAAAHIHGRIGQEGGSASGQIHRESVLVSLQERTATRGAEWRRRTLRGE